MFDLRRWCGVCFLCIAVGGAHEAAGGMAERVIDRSHFDGGVCVVVGDADGDLAMQVHRLVPNSLVHGLTRDRQIAAGARQQLFDAGMDGRVTFDTWNGRTIPFMADFVNLLVIPDGQKVDPVEVRRVLAPGGTVVRIRGDQVDSETKLRPKELDDWTHYLYGPDNNPVSKDKAVKPPLYHLKWVGSPRWSRHHDVMSSVSACVSADNKIYYVFDEGLTFSPFLPSRWKLICRDAFNGTILWKRDIDKWYPTLQNLKSGPCTLPRRLVAVGKHVYITMGIEAAVSELDSETGKTLRVLEGTEGTEEILFDSDTLFLIVDRNPDKKELSSYPRVPVSNWAERDKHVVRVDLRQGKAVWDALLPWVAPLSLALDPKQVYLHDGYSIKALSRENGEEIWNSITLPLRKNTSQNFGPSLVVRDGVVVYSGGENPVRDYGSREKMFGLSTKDGRKMWEAFHPASGYRSPEDLFVIDDVVWAGDVTAHRWAGELGATGVFYGTDLKKGKTEAEFAPNKDAYWFHHRCHVGKATENYLLMSRTGIEFVDIKNHEWTLHHWVRGACLYGIMPANGMIYAPQHPCACYIGAKLYGFNALSAKDRESLLPQTPEPDRLIKGAEFSAPYSDDAYPEQWPTYRQGNRRNGAMTTAVPSSLGQRWTTRLNGVSTPPVIAGGKVLLSLKDQQAVVALDAESGEVAYRYFPAGRVDSPPTIYGGRVYFGCTDGCVYCLRLDSGKLVWKYQAAPTPAHHMYFEHLEATHPVHGSVLVRDDKVYTVCGRSMFVDGGMRFLILDARTGRKVAERVMDDKVPGTDDELQMHHEFLNMPMALPDILSCNDKKIFMRFQEFDLDGNRLELDFPRKLYAKDIADKDRSVESLQDQKGPDAHVFSGTGLLDDSWWHRTYWIYGKNYGSGWPGYYLAGKSTPSGRILSADSDGVFGWGRLKQYYRWSKTYQFMLFSTDYEYQTRWARNVPLLVRSMVKTGRELHLCGPEELINQELALRTVTTPQTQDKLADQAAALEGRRGALLLTVNAGDGSIERGYQLKTTPVFDGLTSVGGKLYLALSDGTITCLGAGGSPLTAIDSAKIAEYNAHAALAPATKGRKNTGSGAARAGRKKNAAKNN